MAHPHGAPWWSMVVGAPWWWWSVMVVVKFVLHCILEAWGHEGYWDHEETTAEEEATSSGGKHCGRSRSRILGTRCCWLAEVHRASNDPENEGEGSKDQAAAAACAVECPQNVRLALVFCRIDMDARRWKALTKDWLPRLCKHLRAWVLHTHDGSSNDLLVHSYCHWQWLEPRTGSGSAESELLSRAETRLGNDDLELSHLLSHLLRLRYWRCEHWHRGCHRHLWRLHTRVDAWLKLQGWWQWRHCLHMGAGSCGIGSSGSSIGDDSGWNDNGWLRGWGLCLRSSTHCLQLSLQF